MSSTPHQPDQTPGPTPETTQHYASILTKLLQAAQQIARALHTRITNSNPETSPVTRRTADAFNIVTRCIRRCILVAQKLAEPPCAPTQPAPEPKAPATEPKTQTTPSSETIRVRADRLPNRPIPEIIAGIYRDLARVAARTDLDPETRDLLQQLKSLCTPPTPTNPQPSSPIPETTEGHGIAWSPTQPPERPPHPVTLKPG